MSARHPRPRPAALWADGAPAERWLHGVDDQVDLRGQSVLSPIEELRRMRRIDDDHVRAADRFNIDHAFGIDGLAGTIGRRGCPDKRIIAMGRHREAVAAIGTDAAAWIEAIVVRQLSLRHLAERLGKPADYVVEHAVAALAALTAHYRNVDRQRAAARRLRELIVA